MKIPTNKISSVIKFFHEELKGIYPEAEIQGFIHLAFEHYLGFSRHDLFLKANDHISESELLHFNFVVKDLKNQRPIQYILGEMEFYGLKFKVNKNVLIPRPETEELVDWIIKDAVNNIAINSANSLEAETKNGGIRILDIGTGSGCIAIALKKNIPGSKVVALDISENALAVARENAINNDVEINFIQYDILGDKFGENDAGYQFDIIVSNPPYICISEKGLMEKNVLEHEPHLALFVEDMDPLQFFDIIADIALLKLKSHGRLYFEINEACGSKVWDMLMKKGFKNIILQKDLKGKDRMIMAKLTNAQNNHFNP